MTLLERALKEHPELEQKGEEITMLLFCPSDLGYQNSANCLAVTPEDVTGDSCRQCWGREDTEEWR